jgi:hypothetical protein
MQFRNYHNLIRCKAPFKGCPAREKGEYWFRSRKGYTVFVFFAKRWWVAKELKHLIPELKPTICLSEKEYQTLALLHNLGRKNWISKEARMMLYEYEEQRALGAIRRDCRIWRFKNL